MPLVQLSAGARTTGGNAALTFPAPLTSGNASIVICASWASTAGAGLLSVIGSVNGAYTRAAINPTSSNFVEVWYKLGVAAGSETITLSGAPADGDRFQTARALEWSGVTAFDKWGGRATLLTDGALDYVPASAPNAVAASLVVGGFGWNDGADPAVWNMGPTETLIWSEVDPNSYTAAALAYRVASSIETSRLSLANTSVPGAANTIGAVATFSLASAPTAYVLDVTPSAVTVARPAALLAQARQLNVTRRAYAVARPSAQLARLQNLDITPRAVAVDMRPADLVLAAGSSAYTLDVEPSSVGIATPAALLSLAARLDVSPSGSVVAWAAVDMDAVEETIAYVLDVAPLAVVSTWPAASASLAARLDVAPAAVAVASPATLLALARVLDLLPLDVLVALSDAAAGVALGLDVEPFAVAVDPVPADIVYTDSGIVTPTDWIRYTIGAEVRAYTIPGETRTAVIPAERRTWSITRG